MENVNRKELKRYNTIEIDTSISGHAGILIKTYHLSHGLMIPDALIAATAIRNNLPLLSANQKDFRFIKGLELIEIQEDNS